MSRPILVGAVIYDPKVVVIWEIIQAFFEAQGCPIDTVFYTNYELQTEALVKGQIHVAWNSPLAWLDCARQTSCRAIAMRDTDRDRVSHVIVRRGRFGAVSDLRGLRVAFGAKDSPQATLIPQGLLRRHGLEPGADYTAVRFDVLVGKHGDHIGGELDALRAMQSGDADAACVLDLNWQNWSTDGTVDPAQFEVLATTDPFDHCVFAVRADFPVEDEERFLRALFAMSYDEPQHREMMDLEGLKKWEPGRTSGFGPLTEAVAASDYWNQR